MTFQIDALAPDAFAPLFAMTDAQLSARKARRMPADAHGGMPCRVTAFRV